MVSGERRFDGGVGKHPTRLFKSWRGPFDGLWLLIDHLLCGCNPLALTIIGLIIQKGIPETQIIEKMSSPEQFWKNPITQCWDVSVLHNGIRKGTEGRSVKNFWLGKFQKRSSRGRKQLQWKGIGLSVETWHEFLRNGHPKDNLEPSSFHKRYVCIVF